MKKISKIAIVLFAFIFFLPSCQEPRSKTKSEFWQLYSKQNRHTCQVNGLPYWDDMLRDCFPRKAGGKELDRIKLQSYPDSVPINYYDQDNKNFETEDYTVPEIFTGYTLLLDYREKPEYEVTANDEIWPLELLLLYSESEVREWLKDCRGGYYMKHYSAGDFTVYQGRLRRGQIEIKWAFFDDRLCILHQIKDRPYQVANAELFDEIVSQIDGECILSLVPD